MKLFPKGLGRIVYTYQMQILLQKMFPGLMKSQDEFTKQLLQRHVNGDWDTTVDAEMNQEAAVSGGKVVSAYQTSMGSVWVVTDPGHTQTVIGLSDDF